MSEFGLEVGTAVGDAQEEKPLEVASVVAGQTLEVADARYQVCGSHCSCGC